MSNSNIGRPKIVRKEFIHANTLDVEIEHNGRIPGDTGHGGYVKITFDNMASTDMRLFGKDVDVIEFEFHGEAERQTFLDAFKAIVEELEK